MSAHQATIQLKNMFVKNVLLEHIGMDLNVIMMLDFNVLKDIPIMESHVRQISSQPVELESISTKMVNVYVSLDTSGLMLNVKNVHMEPTLMD